MAGKRSIKKGLIEQFKKNKISGDHYLDLINDYMAMWDIKNKLIKDIKDKGVSVKYQNGENQWGHKKNDSVGELNRINAQMLKVLDFLGLKVSDSEKEESGKEMEM